MINFQRVIDFIKISIKRNGKREITGDLLQQNLLGMVDVTSEAYDEVNQTIGQKEAESKERDEALGGRIDDEGASLTALTDRVTDNESAIADIKAKDFDQDTRINGLVDDTTQIKADAAVLEAKVDLNKRETDSAINEISGDIAGIKETDIRQDREIGEINATIDEISGDIAGIKDKDLAQDALIEANKNEIAEVKGSTQIKDLDVEIRNVGAGRFVSSESASEIYAHAIKGGNVKIQWENKKYEFVEYKQSTAYFRCISVSADKVTENSIEIYNKDAQFKTIEYKAIFDATPLLTSFTSQTPLSAQFISDLDEALAEKKLIFVSGNGTIYLLVGTSKEGSKRTFTGVGGRTVYVLSYGTNRIVSLDTHKVGADIHIFNNREGVNILNLTTDSSASEIGEVFTDSFGEKVLPHTGDIFNIFQNSDMAHSGIVESMVEDSVEIRLAVNMSNFEDNLIHRVFYKISYNPSVGFPSLNITQKVENVVNPSKIAEDAIDKMQGDINANKAKVDKTANEVNEYNISAINSETYTLQGAISALNAYLGGGARKVGIKVTFVETGVNKAKTYTYQGGSFVSTNSWKDEPLGGYMKDAILRTIEGISFNEISNTYSYRGYTDLSVSEAEEIYRVHNWWVQPSQRGAFIGYKARVIPFSNKFDLISSNMQFDFNYAFFLSIHIEKIGFLEGEVKVGGPDMRNAFEGCIRLKDIGYLDVSNVSQFLRTFTNSGAIETIFLKGFNADYIAFAKAKNIKKECLMYLVENKIYDGASTVTLENSVFAKVSSPDAEWGDVYQEAQRMNVVFNTI